QTFEILTAIPSRKRRKPRQWSDDEKAEVVGLSNRTPPVKVVFAALRRYRFADKAIRYGSDLLFRSSAAMSSSRAVRCREQGCLRGRQRPPHDGSSQVTIFLCFVRSRDDLQPDKRNDRTHVRSRDAQCIKSDLMRRGYWAGDAYAAAPADALNTSPVVSMLCIMTESFLATATAA